MEKSELEGAIKEIVGLGMGERKSPTKIIISPYLLKVAESIVESNRDKHEIKVDFNE